MLREVQIVQTFSERKQSKYTVVPKQAVLHGVSKEQIRYGVRFHASVYRRLRIIPLPHVPHILTGPLSAEI